MLGVTHRARSQWGASSAPGTAPPCAASRPLRARRERSARARRAEGRAAAEAAAPPAAPCRVQPRRAEARHVAPPAAGPGKALGRACAAQRQRASARVRSTDAAVSLPPRRAPRMMTLVVPSPTSSSCVRASSIMLCDASRARRVSGAAHAQPQPRCAAVPWPPGATRRSRAELRCHHSSAQCLRGRSGSGGARRVSLAARASRHARRVPRQACACRDAVTHRRRHPAASSASSAGPAWCG